MRVDIAHLKLMKHPNSEGITRISPSTSPSSSLEKRMESSPPSPGNIPSNHSLPRLIRRNSKYSRD